ncbi:MAG: SurA N-terminal domain-containing protein [Patescibacteria group bacterium]
MATKKSTKKTNKRTTKSSPLVKKTPVTSATSTVESPREELKNQLNTNNRALATGILVLALVITAAFMLYKKSVAAYVNGEPISRLEVIKQLEKQSGKTILNQMVTEKLILQEAKKRNVTISQADLNKEIKTVEKSLTDQGTTLDQALESQGMTKAQLNDQLKIQLLVQKMVKPSVVSDKEVDSYIETNQEQITPEELAEPAFKGTIKNQLIQQKQQSDIQKFITDLQSKAKIDTVVKY